MRPETFGGRVVYGLDETDHDLVRYGGERVSSPVPEAPVQTWARMIMGG